MNAQTQPRTGEPARDRRRIQDTAQSLGRDTIDTLCLALGLDVEAGTTTTAAAETAEYLVVMALEMVAHMMANPTEHNLDAVDGMAQSIEAGIGEDLS